MKRRSLILWLALAFLPLVSCQMNETESARSVLSQPERLAELATAAIQVDVRAPTSTLAPTVPVTGVVEADTTAQTVSADDVTTDAAMVPEPPTPTSLPVATQTTVPTDTSVPVVVTGETGALVETPPVTEEVGVPPTATSALVSSGETNWSVSPALLGASGPQVYETAITIPTYDYESGFQLTTEEDPVYPYPRLDMSRVGPPSPRAYRAIILENGFVSLTILPELGGRIYRWVDKATGENLLYENPVIKPTSWGYRGWWLAAGGIEWAFPVEEHGLNEYRPWQTATGSTPYGLAVTVSDVDSRTGMTVGATISLDGGHGYVTIQPWARNDTANPHEYQLWLNAMLALNGNTMSGQTRFVLPAAEVTVHSTGDGGAPGSGSPMSWPYYGGRDMSLYGNWTGYLGFFVPNVTQGFTGVYDLASDQGVVRVYSPGWPAGTKIFGPGTLSPSLWTDDNSTYIELWSGATSSFWSNATLNPGETFSWTEHWYPVHGMGGLSFANRAAAVRLAEEPGAVAINVAVPAAFSGQIELHSDQGPVAQWPVTLYPSQVFSAMWPRPDGSTGPVTLRLVATDGTVAAESRGP